MAVVEDAGDTLHTQRGTLDSGYAVPSRSDYPAIPAPVRFLAEGRDPSATIDCRERLGFGKNEGDNEITGIHVSDGDSTVAGLLGTRNPAFLSPGEDGTSGACSGPSSTATTSPGRSGSNDAEPRPGRTRPRGGMAAPGPHSFPAPSPRTARSPTRDPGGAGKVAAFHLIDRGPQLHSAVLAGRSLPNGRPPVDRTARPG